MNYLLDTHLLIWVATRNPKLSKRAAAIIADRENNLWFSTASIWETAIKSALGRPDFPFDAGILRAGLLANGYEEVAIKGRHAVVYQDLPALHRDPFDRMLVAQALSEGMKLLTADNEVAAYGAPVVLV